MSSEVKVNTIESSYILQVEESNEPSAFSYGGNFLGDNCEKFGKHGRYFGDKGEVTKDMECKCQKCEKTFKVKTVGFLGCSYKISGLDLFGNQFEEEGLSPKNEFKCFNVSEAKCESVVIYVNIKMRDIRFPEEQEFCIQTIWTAKQFIDFYQEKIGNYTPLMLMINERTVLFNERICDVIEQNKIYNVEFSCVPISYIEEN